MNAGDVLTFKLPKIIDPENDNVQVIVNFGFASEFSSQASNNLIFSPNSTIKGIYSIQLFLIDSNKNKALYTLNLIVYP